MKHQTIWLAASVTFCVALSGCGSPDSGLTRDQVDVMLDTQASLQEERSAVSRERADLSQARDQLESDRRLWHERARTDPIIAAAIGSAALLLVCCLPLIVIGLLLWPRSQEPEERELCDALILDATSEHPRLLDSPRSPKRLE